jgi:hypothetical protein
MVPATIFLFLRSSYKVPSKLRYADLRNQSMRQCCEAALSSPRLSGDLAKSFCHFGQSQNEGSGKVNRSASLSATNVRMFFTSNFKMNKGPHTATMYVVFDRNLEVLPSPESMRRRKPYTPSLDQDDEDDVIDESTEYESEPEFDEEEASMLLDGFDCCSDITELPYQNTLRTKTRLFYIFIITLKNYY